VRAGLLSRACYRGLAIAGLGLNAWFLRAAIVYNPRSGRAQAQARARAVAGALVAAGWDAPLVPIAEAGALGRNVDVLVVAGGDGTVTSLLTLAAELDAPIYHVPCGNENLFARELGHTYRPAGVLAALRALRRARMDVMDVTDEAGAQRRAVLMATLGPDASVIDRLARARTRAVGHAAYFVPVLQEALEPCFPRVRVRVDGRELSDGASPGHVVVANSRHYAMGINPCPSADAFDGLLEVCVVAQQTPGEHMAWLVAHRLRMPGLLGEGLLGVGLLRARGRVVELEVLGPAAPVQIDGERFAVRPSRALRIEVCPGRVVAGGVPVVLGTSRTDPWRGVVVGSTRGQIGGLAQPAGFRARQRSAQSVAPSSRLGAKPDDALLREAMAR